VGVPLNRQRATTTSELASDYDDVEIMRGGIDMSSQGGDSVYLADAMRNKKLGGIIN
jgi:hypothetical protein